MVDIDLFPAVVRAPGVRWERARASIRSGRLRVWTAANGERVLTAEVDVEFLEREGARYVATIGGEEWELENGGRCGCGSPLRKFDPWA